MRPSRLSFTAALAAMSLLVGCSGSDRESTANVPSAQSPSAKPGAEPGAIQFTTSEVTTFDVPNGAATWTLSNPGPFDGDLTMGTTGRSESGWVEVVVPVLPNRTTGWVRSDITEALGVTTKLVVDLSERTVTLFKNGSEVTQVRAGIGKAATPTPIIDAIVDHTGANGDPTGTYGSWTIGLNQHSEVLATFDGGRPAIALHGTANPSDIGAAVSNGCVRISNADITALGPLVPLGTRVEIRE